MGIIAGFSDVYVVHACPSHHRNREPFCGSEYQFAGTDGEGGWAIQQCYRTSAACAAVGLRRRRRRGTLADQWTCEAAT